MIENTRQLTIRKQELLDNSKILIIEDDYISRLVIKEIFKELGFAFVEDVENGQIGFEVAKKIKPDLIIMDVQMPEMDGITCCQLIRNTDDISDTAILVQTALNETDDKARVFEAGADDYISKPIDPYEITARSILHLERLMMLKKLKSYHERVRSELDMARQTQSVLLPDEQEILKLSKDYNIEMKSYFKTSSELGGDFWGMQSLSSQKLALYQVDFTGHGVNAALNTFRLHALMHNNLTVTDQPGAYLTYLNAILAPLLPTGQFATMFYAVIDFEKNELAYASAAAPYPILFVDKGSSAEALKENNLPLGVQASKVYKTRTVPFKQKDMLFLYSDALIETLDSQGAYLDIDEIVYLVQEFFGCQESFDVNKGFSGFLDSFQKRHFECLKDDLTLNFCYRC